MKVHLEDVMNYLSELTLETVAFSFPGLVGLRHSDDTVGRQHHFRSGYVITTSPMLVFLVLLFCIYLH